ncbi:cobalt transporter CbiM [Tengunoibacter tsumagoiensis]|uniref:Cobalamin biosynthesis protein CbiM n=1 Tax=Tengunoibacter tsumagoiensis TaxID=2014871 RepID=A0A402AAI0_9CHLR|nr:cobalt transporter CbiM [Tengunoibacter tsumagoiensis]GCE16046.1 hypothetical protein KTT_59050 [Tengunoibacter tsumagoiensis]
MHIPDGYLSPVFSLGAGLATVPVWGVAVNKVQKVLNNRTVPLLAIFSAFSFTIMMFNIPVPGGTTAHAVGGTMIAIVLGPWAAVIGVSIALIIQALFFGDGGVLAIFANCLNMGIILPFVGYFSYKLIAGRAALLSTRRVWAAGIGSYLGITMSALAVGIELGLQPLLFHTANGQALYSPYALNVAVPTMLLSHSLGASIVEALVTAMGIGYIQKNYPGYLSSLRSVVSGEALEVGEPQRIPTWQFMLLGGLTAIALLFITGLLTGKGQVSHLFGADWNLVDWSAVGMMLLIIAGIALVLIPLAWYLLPRNIRRAGTFLVTFAILAPLGLIAPGFAFGEGSATDVKQAFGYIPQGLKQFSTLWSAPFGGYNLNAPFFTDPGAPLWRQAIGYEMSGIIGILLIGALLLISLTLLRRSRQSSISSSQSVEQRRGSKASW